MSSNAVAAIHLILDGCATHRGGVVLALAGELGVVLPFIPPGLTELLQPLDRSISGALRAEYRAIYRDEMSQRQEKRMTKADCGAYLILAWDLVSDQVIHQGME
jgi:hypothetical protein